jgi:hypothetical protein
VLLSLSASGCDRCVQPTLSTATKRRPVGAIASGSLTSFVDEEVVECLVVLGTGEQSGRPGDEPVSSRHFLVVEGLLYFSPVVAALCGGGIGGLR